MNASSPAPHRRPIVITVFNYKGGVGKTTTSVNLAVGLAALGCRTILIDLDGQGNATSSLGMATRAAVGAHDLISGSVDLAGASHPTPYPGLLLCPATDELAGADMELALTPQPQGQLRLRLEEGAADADVVVIDCPPALGILPVNALVACDWVILPVSPEPLAREGLHKAWYNVNRIHLNLNRGLQVMGILVTLAEVADVHDRFDESIRADFGPRVLPIKIPRDQAVLEASAKDCPVLIHDPDSPAARAYVNLAAAVHATVLEPAGIGLDEPKSQEETVRSMIATLHTWRRQHFRESGADTRTVDVYSDPAAAELPPRPPSRINGLLMFVLGLAAGASAVVLWIQWSPIFL